jgi:hypothetical protein
MLNNKYLPYYQFSERHTIKIDAPKNRILAAIIELPPNEISFIFKLLFIIRSIPPKLLGRPYIGFRSNVPLIEQLEENGFALLDKNSQEIVLGVVLGSGKSKERVTTPVKDFMNPGKKGYGKVATNFFIKEEEGNVLLSTETRIFLRDKKTKRKFTLYWLVVYPGSALIRRLWLKAIKKRSESGI